MKRSLAIAVTNAALDVIEVAAGLYPGFKHYWINRSSGEVVEAKEGHLESLYEDPSMFGLKSVPSPPKGYDRWPEYMTIPAATQKKITKKWIRAQVASGDATFSLTFPLRKKDLLTMQDFVAERLGKVRSSVYIAETPGDHMWSIRPGKAFLEVDSLRDMEES